MPLANLQIVSLANLKRRQRRGLWKQHELFAFVIKKEDNVGGGGSFGNTINFSHLQLKNKHLDHLQMFQVYPICKFKKKLQTICNVQNVLHLQIKIEEYDPL
jgi:hypothetical protein